MRIHFESFLEQSRKTQVEPVRSALMQSLGLPCGLVTMIVDYVLAWSGLGNLVDAFDEDENGDGDGVRWHFAT